MLNKVWCGKDFQTGRCIKLLAIILLSLGAGCKARKALVAAPVADSPVKTASTKESKIAAIKARQVFFNTFFNKAR